MIMDGQYKHTEKAEREKEKVTGEIGKHEKILHSPVR